MYSCKGIIRRCVCSVFNRSLSVIYWFDYREYNGNITEYIRTVTQTEGINTVDIMFLNGLDPISSIESMNRLNSLMQ